MATRADKLVPQSIQAEIDRLTQQYNQQPISWDQNDAGQWVGTRSMDRPSLPPELEKWYWYYADLFNPPEFYGGGSREPLTNTWLLPADAFTGPQQLTRDVPTTDIERYRGHEASTQPRSSTMNPGTYWPNMAFNAPTRTGNRSSYLGSINEPVFGSTIDYGQDRWYAPQQSQLRVEPFGTFEGARKRPPNMGSSQYRPFNPWSFATSYGPENFSTLWF